MLVLAGEEVRVMGVCGQKVCARKPFYMYEAVPKKHRTPHMKDANSSA